MTTGQKFFEQHKAQLIELCRRYPVERLYLFGSILTDQFDPKKSDVDVQVFFEANGDPIEMGKLKWNFWDELENLFGRKVDMFTEQPLQNPFFKKEIESTRHLVYERKREEAFV
ncbi:MAG: nucleotidyltransferase domain-containing protein [Saprospiraceae bacterium]